MSARQLPLLVYIIPATFGSESRGGSAFRLGFTLPLEGEEDVRHRAYCLRPRAGRLLSSSRLRPFGLRRGRPPAPRKVPRARGTPGVHSDPRASLSRDIEAPYRGGPRVAPGSERGRPSASPPNPRRPARGVYRLAPLRPRWSTVRRAASKGPCATLHRDETSARPGDLRPTALWLGDRRGLGARRGAPGLGAAWTAGWGLWRRISDAPNRPPLPTPRSGDA